MSKKFTLKTAEVFAIELGLDPTKLIDLGEGWFTFFGSCNVTPAVARNWLDKYNTENRTPKSRNIIRMAKDIAADMWHVTHQGIAFRDDKILGDGQNRCMAIIRAGKSAKIRIFFGLTKEGMLAIDGGAPRSNLDSITLQGVATTHKCLAALRFFEGGKGGEADLSSEQLMNLLVTRKEELEFVFKNIPAKSKSGVTAGVRAPIMRAYHVHKGDAAIIKKLTAFCHCLFTGENIPSTGSGPLVSKFRTNLLKQEYGGEGRKAIYQYTEDVVYHYLFNETGRFRRHDEELFPLDGENNGQKI